MRGQDCSSPRSCYIYLRLVHPSSFLTYVCHVRRTIPPRRCRHHGCRESSQPLERRLRLCCDHQQLEQHLCESPCLRWSRNCRPSVLRIREQHHTGGTMHLHPCRGPCVRWVLPYAPCLNPVANRSSLRRELRPMRRRGPLPQHWKCASPPRSS